MQNGICDDCPRVRGCRLGFVSLRGENSLYRDFNEYRLKYVKGLMTLVRGVETGRLVHERGNILAALEGWVWAMENEQRFPCGPAIYDITSRAKRLINDTQTGVVH